MPASLANNRSVARQVTLTAIALVALVLVLVGLAIAVLTERSTRAQVVASVGDTAQSVAQSLDAADNTNRELVQLTMKGFQRYFEATMQLDEASGELRSYGALVNEDYGSVDKFASGTTASWWRGTFTASCSATCPRAAWPTSRRRVCLRAMSPTGASCTTRSCSTLSMPWATRAGWVANTARRQGHRRGLAGGTLPCATAPSTRLKSFRGPAPVRANA